MKLIVKQSISKEICRAEHECINIHPPIIALVTALHVFCCISLKWKSKSE